MTDHLSALEKLWIVVRTLGEVTSVVWAGDSPAALEAEWMRRYGQPLPEHTLHQFTTTFRGRRVALRAYDGGRLVVMERGYVRLAELDAGGLVRRMARNLADPRLPDR